VSKLIQALQILLKYGDLPYPTCCGHDVLYICGIDYSAVSAEDRSALEALGFLEGDDDNFISIHFGST